MRDLQLRLPGLVTLAEDTHGQYEAAMELRWALTPRLKLSVGRVSEWMQWI